VEKVIKKYQVTYKKLQFAPCHYNLYILVTTELMYKRTAMFTSYKCHKLLVNGIKM